MFFFLVRKIVFANIHSGVHLKSVCIIILDQPYFFFLDLKAAHLGCTDLTTDPELIARCDQYINVDPVYRDGRTETVSNQIIMEKIIHKY